jgi:hypothetical protein
MGGNWKKQEKGDRKRGQNYLSFNPVVEVQESPA